MAKGRGRKLKLNLKKLNITNEHFIILGLVIVFVVFVYMNRQRLFEGFQTGVPASADTLMGSHRQEPEPALGQVRIGQIPLSGNDTGHANYSAPGDVAPVASVASWSENAQRENRERGRGGAPVGASNEPCPCPLLYPSEPLDACKARCAHASAYDSSFSPTSGVYTTPDVTAPTVPTAIKI